MSDSTLILTSRERARDAAASTGRDPEVAVIDKGSSRHSALSSGRC